MEVLSLYNSSDQNNRKDVLKLYPNEMVFLIIYIVELAYFGLDYLYWIIGSNIHKVIAFFALFMIFVYSLRRIKTSIRLLVFIPLFLLSSFLILHYNGSGMGTIIQLFWPITLITIYGNSKQSKDFLKILSIISAAFIIILTLKAILFYRGVKYENFLDNGGRQVNPNVTAMILAYLYWYSVLYIETIKRVLLAIVVCIGITSCGSRTALLIFVASLFTKILFQKRMRTDKVFVLLIMLMIISIGIVFPIIYVRIYESRDLADGELMGKQVFTGRQDIWMSFFNYLNMHPDAYWIGTGFNDSFYKKGVFNLHNSYLMLFAQYGIFVACAYYCFIIAIIWKMYRDECINDMKLSFLIIVIINLCYGITEISLSYIPILIFPAFAIAMCNNREVDYNNGNSKNNSLLLVWWKSKTG